jgi:hypothetical protein
MHSKAMWPIHGRYVCPDCGREYPVVWETIPAGGEYAVSAKPKRSKAAFSFRVLSRYSLFRNSRRHTEAL